MDKNKLLSYFFLISAMIIVSSSFPVGKMAIAILPVFLLSGLRYAVVMIFFLPGLFIYRSELKQLSRRDLLLLLLQAFFGVWVFNIFLFFGLKYLSSANSGILLGTVPAIVTILSAIFYKESMGIKQWIGVTLAMISVWLVQSSQSSFQSIYSYEGILGVIFVMLAAIGEAFFLFISKATSSRVNPIVSAMLISAFGFVLLTPLALWEGWQFEFRQLTSTDWLIVVYFGIGITFLGYILWFKGVSMIPVGKAAVFTAVMPISAVFLSIVFLEEELHFSHLLSLGLIVLAIRTCLSEGKQVKSKSNQLIDKIEYQS